MPASAKRFPCAFLWFTKSVFGTRKRCFLYATIKKKYKYKYKIYLGPYRLTEFQSRRHKIINILTINTGFYFGPEKINKMFNSKRFIHSQRSVKYIGWKSSKRFRVIPFLALFFTRKIIYLLYRK